MSVFLIYTFCTSFPSFSNAFPLQPRANSTTKPGATGSSTVGWTEAPQLRGTSDLIISCLTTLSLCAWTAYHPNVYSNRTIWKQFLHRATWMLTAVVVPEVVLYCAWEQWWEARKLKRDINEIGEMAFDGVGPEAEDSGNCQACGARDAEGKQSSEYHLDLLFGDVGSEVDPDQSSTKNNSRSWRSLSFTRFFTRKCRADPKVSPELETWSTVQAFFAISGGFAVPSSTFHPSTHLTLTPPALLFLAQHGLLPHSTTSAVADKSKADAIAKALVCIQAGWFLLQCIARVAQKLPLTLLEIHVLTHVCCAFAMYVLWGEKPYDVGAPVLCEDERVINLVAFWALHVDLKSQRSFDGSLQCPQASQTTTFFTKPLTTTQVQSAHLITRSPSSLKRYKTLIIEFLDCDSLYQAPNPLQPLTLSASFFKRKNSQTLSKAAQLRAITLKPPPSSLHLTHLQKAAAGLEYLRNRSTHFPYRLKSVTYKFPPSPTTSVDSIGTYYEDEDVELRFPLRYVVPTRSNLIVDGRSAIKSAGKDRESHSKLMLKTYSVMSLTYGGLHLAAWSFHFPTRVEQWLWRSSGLLMAGSPLLGLFLVLIWQAMTWFEKCQKSAGRCRVAQLGCRVLKNVLVGVSMVGVVMVVVALVAYPVARLYVLVESFACLRSVDKAVYTTTEWTGFIPHAG